MEQIYIPDERLGRQALDADFPLPSRALLAHPDDSKLGLILIVLDMEDLACPDRADHSVQHRPAITDVSDLGMLRKGHGLGVDTPDAHRQECGDTSTATTIHKPRLNPTAEKVRHISGSRNLQGHPETGTESHLRRLLQGIGNAWVFRRNQSMSGIEQAPGPRGSPQLPQAPTDGDALAELLADMAKTDKLLRQFLALAFWAFGFAAAIH